jgi:repressor LexA
MKALTPKQRDTLETIMFFVQRYGYPPTLRELACRFDITTNAARDRVRALRRKGYITFDNQARCFKVLRNPAGNDVRLRFEEVRDESKTGLSEITKQKHVSCEHE